ncbi:hypothetical protein PENTCL1PPCAC_29134, partial [Pristionchus entomophagus]
SNAFIGTHENRVLLEASTSKEIALRPSSMPNCTPLAKSAKRERLFSDDQENNRPNKKQAAKISNTHTDNRREENVKDEEDEETMQVEEIRPSTSRNVSDESVEPVRTNNVTDGKLQGRPLPARERITLEHNSLVVYSFPHYANIAQAKRQIKSGERILDLMLDGEIGAEKGNDDRDYVITDILAIDKFAALIIWEGFQFPTWQIKDIVKTGKVRREYNQRVELLDCIMKDICRNESLQSMRDHYPNMMINQTMDYHEYDQRPGVVYLAGLRKRERQINDFLDHRFGVSNVGSTLTIEDWTDFESSSIPTFEYVFDSTLTDDAAKIEQRLQSNATGCPCTGRCTSDKHLAPQCCAHVAPTKIAFITKDILGNVEKPADDSDDDDDNDEASIEQSPDYVDVNECGDACFCANLCIQRVVQKGVRLRLVVFRHHEKGWTLRTGVDIPTGRFISEYNGLMMTLEQATQKDRTYQMGLDVMTTDGKVETLVIDSQHKGNESRFLSLSCEPNVFSNRVHFEISGRPKRHIGLFAARDIKAGEELTFDYYPNMKDPVKFHKANLFGCKCGSEKCREKKYQEMQKNKKKVLNNK